MFSSCWQFCLYVLIQVQTLLLLALHAIVGAREFTTYVWITIRRKRMAQMVSTIVWRPNSIVWIIANSPHAENGSNNYCNTCNDFTINWFESREIKSLPSLCNYMFNLLQQYFLLLPLFNSCAWWRNIIKNSWNQIYSNPLLIFAHKHDDKSRP